MKAVRFAIAALLAVGLSGCFTSTAPLVTDETAVAPYGTLTFRNQNGDDPITFTREAGHYVTSRDDETVSLHLLPVEDDFFVGQLTGPGAGQADEILYGYLRLDPAGGVAEIWRSVGGSKDVRPGLSECKGGICIDDIAAYIAYGREAVAAGLTPDTTLSVTAE